MTKVSSRHQRTLPDVGAQLEEAKDVDRLAFDLLAWLKATCLYSTLCIFDTLNFHTLNNELYNDGEKLAALGKYVAQGDELSQLFKGVVFKTVSDCFASRIFISSNYSRGWLPEPYNSTPTNVACWPLHHFWITLQCIQICSGLKFRGRTKWHNCRLSKASLSRSRCIRVCHEASIVNGMLKGYGRSWGASKKC